MKRITTSLLMLVALLGSASVGAAEPAFYFGAATHLGWAGYPNAWAGHPNGLSEPDAVKELLSGAGLNSFRDELNWSGLEKKKGVFRHPRIHQSGRVHQMITDKGSYSPLIILGYNNRLYRSVDSLNQFYYGGYPRGSETIEGFARYAEYVASRYRNSVPLFEVWNEWNGGQGQSVRYESPNAETAMVFKRRVSESNGEELGTMEIWPYVLAEDYVKLLKAAEPRVRRAAPNAKILAGATSGNDENWSVKFVEAGGLDYSDGFSIHPYFSSRTIRPNHTSEIMFDALKTLQEKMYAAASPLYKSSHPTGIPFYFTEVGFTNVPAYIDPDDPTKSKPAGPTEEEAADYAVKFALLVRTLPYVKGIWWYELVNSDTADAERHFGLYRRVSENRTAKPIANELKRISNSVINGRDFKLVTSGGVGSVYKVEWIENNSPKQATWTRGVIGITLP
jgi:hypothetical protein